MASITYDGQSFMIDGRRIWIVSGSIQYARIPRALWAERINAAKLAGLNTVETPVFWARHEPRQGQFDFTGENDIRHFVQLVHQAGMLCILRPGPFIGAAWDLGGLPSWLLGIPNIKLRAPSAPFLEACSRFITALAHQVRDLQVTSPGEGGPVLLIQNESAWTCGDDQLASHYLGELNRYFREAGLTVPTVNANDLWQGVEGEIDAWTGFDQLLSHLRQLGAVRPDQPRIVIDFRLGTPDIWGRPPAPRHTPHTMLRRLVEVLAAGGQYNLSPFSGGTTFGFSGGRDPSAYDGFYTSSYDCGAPISETGAAGAALPAVRRLSTFASRFARVLANLDSRRPPIIQQPTPPPAPAKGRGGAPTAPAHPAPSIVHAAGLQGSVVFIFGDESGAATSQPLTLLLPDGSSLPVDIGAESAGWCLFDARLTGRTTLDYCNLSAFAVVGRVFVCFGPAGTRGILSINGSRLEIDVPTGRDPLITEHEGIVVVVCATEQTGAVFADDDAVYVGVEGLTLPGPGAPSRPLPHPSYRTYTRISATGETASLKAASLAPAGRPAPAAGGGKKRAAAPPPAPAETGPRNALGPWSSAAASDYADGTNARYASITGPADLDSLGAPYGYGWYRIRLKSAPGGRHRVLFPQAGDRLHLTLDGEPAGVVGLGPGAEPEGHLTLRKGPHTLVVLAENLGRFAGGMNMTQRVGLYGHAWTVTPLRPGTPKVETGQDPLDPLAFEAPFWGIHRGETTDPDRVTWTITHRRKSPIFFRLYGAGVSGLVLLNGAPIRAFDPAGFGPITIDAAALSRGNNSVQLALMGPPGVAQAMCKRLADAAEFFEGDENLTDTGLPPGTKPSKATNSDAKTEWAFAKWEPPPPDAFEAVGKVARHGAAVPRWWRSSFTPDDSHAPLSLDLTGMTKGQIYINGRHLGRYFVATADGKAVPPQSHYIVPRAFIDRAGPSEVLLFDEHGASPAKVKIASAAGEHRP